MLDSVQLDLRLTLLSVVHSGDLLCLEKFSLGQRSAKSPCLCKTQYEPPILGVSQLQILISATATSYPVLFLHLAKTYELLSYFCQIVCGVMRRVRTGEDSSHVRLLATKLDHCPMFSTVSMTTSAGIVFFDIHIHPSVSYIRYHNFVRDVHMKKSRRISRRRQRLRV